MSRSAVSTEELKRVLARWATGVTIVTSRAGDRVHGMTVTAFTEASIEPPLVLICADRSSSTHAAIAQGRVFAVNLLSDEQQALSQRFASQEEESRRFDGLEVETGKTGAPLISGALAALDCRVVAAHEAGDHVIYVGHVAEARYADREPLLYYAGAYRKLSEREG